MSAFGRKLGQTAGKGGFGSARPLKGGSLQAVGDPLDGPSPSAASNSAPTEIAPAPGEMAEIASHLTHALARLAERESPYADAGISPLGGFEASVHKIQEQVLSRLQLASAWGR